MNPDNNAANKTCLPIDDTVSILLAFDCIVWINKYEMNDMKTNSYIWDSLCYNKQNWSNEILSIGMDYVHIENL